jgi:hypothetical protein
MNDTMETSGERNIIPAAWAFKIDQVLVDFLCALPRYTKQQAYSPQRNTAYPRLVVILCRDSRNGVSALFIGARTTFVLTIFLSNEK